MLPIDDIKKAVALQYDGENPPKIIAKGEQNIANSMVALAKEHNIPLCDNAALTDLLSRIDIGEDIPEAFYLSVAYILSFAYSMTQLTDTQ